LGDVLLVLGFLVIYTILFYIKQLTIYVYCTYNICINGLIYSREIYMYMGNNTKMNKHSLYINTINEMRYLHLILECERWFYVLYAFLLVFFFFNLFLGCFVVMVRRFAGFWVIKYL